MGYDARFKDDFSFTLDDGRIVRLSQSNASIGTSVYTAALQMSKYLEHTLRSTVKGEHVVELVSAALYACTRASRPSTLPLCHCLRHHHRVVLLLLVMAFMSLIWCC
jgi:hypothetical protein